MQEKVRVLLVQVLVEPIDTGGVEERAAPLDAMDGVPLPQQERGQIGPVLAGDSRDQCCFHLLFLICCIAIHRHSIQYIYFSDRRTTLSLLTNGVDRTKFQSEPPLI